jgi:hypothetical protein
MINANWNHINARTKSQETYIHMTHNDLKLGEIAIFI